MVGRMVPRLLAVALPLVLAACSGGGTGTPSPTQSQPPGLFSPGVLPTADQLCHLLTVDDWTAAGLTGARAPNVNHDPGPDAGSAYCTYAANSGETGGLELDAFVGPTLDDAKTTFAEIAQSLPPSTAPNVSGIDDGLINTDGEQGFGAILVRAGKLVVTITLPISADAGTQLTSLTQLVLSRALALE